MNSNVGYKNKKYVGKRIKTENLSKTVYFPHLDRTDEIN